MFGHIDSFQLYHTKEPAQAPMPFINSIKNNIAINNAMTNMSLPFRPTKRQLIFSPAPTQTQTNSPLTRNSKRNISPLNRYHPTPLQNSMTVTQVTPPKISTTRP